MIYVVEFPHHGRPTAWFAFDREDFARKVHARRTGKHTLSSAASARQRLDAAGLAPDSADARQSEPEVFRLADTHGWDTPLYRADDLPGEGVNRTETVSEFDACVAAIAAGLKACRVYLSDQAATAALYQDPLYDGPEGFHAHMALREQLIALEVIADDLQQAPVPPDRADHGHGLRRGSEHVEPPVAGMTARQLIADMPEDAVVLCGGDGDHAWIGGLEPQRNDSGLPEEVILLPDLRE